MWHDEIPDGYIAWLCICVHGYIQFLDYLYSTHNNVWNEQHNKVNQNMDQPLTNYWIASSHNTWVPPPSHLGQHYKGGYIYTVTKRFWYDGLKMKDSYIYAMGIVCVMSSW